MILPPTLPPSPAPGLTIVRYDHGTHRMEYRCDACSGITRCADTHDERYQCTQPSCRVTDTRERMLRRYREQVARGEIAA